MARPPAELTEPMIEVICAAVRAGATLEHAAYYAGISYKTLSRWLNQGKKSHSGLLAQFYQAIEKARSSLAVSLLLQINSAAKTNWKAAAWELEHLFPDEYGKMNKGASASKESPSTPSALSDSPSS